MGNRGKIGTDNIKHTWHMRRLNAYVAFIYLTALILLAGCDTDSTDPDEDGKQIEILNPTRTDDGYNPAAGTTFRAAVFSSNSFAYRDTGTYFLKNEGDNTLTPAEITYNSENNILSTFENREKALFSYLTSVDVYLVSPACNIEIGNGCLVVNPEEPFYISNKHSCGDLMHYAPLDFSGDILTRHRSRLIVNFYQSSEFSGETVAEISDVVLNNAGTASEVLYHLPTDKVVTDDEHKTRAITLKNPDDMQEITAEGGKTFRPITTTGEMNVVSATYNPYELTSSLKSDYIYLDFNVCQNGATLPQSLLLTDNQFNTLKPGFIYSYKVLLSSEIIQLTLNVSPWSESGGNSTVNSDFAADYNLGTWNITGWSNGTSGESGNGSITNMN